MAASSGNAKANNKSNKNKNPPNQNNASSTKSGGKQKQKKQSHSTFYRNVTLFLCFLGVCVCILALYIEIMKEKNPNYVALCDINSYITCSKVLTSRYGKGFGIVDRIFSKDSILNQPNPVYGLAFYIFQASLVLKLTSQTAVIQLVMSILANIGSVYLSYILFFILQDFCLVCVATYTINFLILVVNFFALKYAITTEISMKSKKKK